MKILERIALILFSIIMLFVSIISCLLIFNIMELKTIFNFLEDVIENQTVTRVILGFAIVSILLAIKSLFFPSKIKKKQEIKTGVLLENKDGRLLISRDTIENLVNSVVKSFTDAVDVQTKVHLDADNNITVFVSLLVKEEAIIKELSANIQNKIKETVKRSTDLDVNQININIKNIENQTKIKINNVQVNQNKTKENKTETNIVK
nr:alkaline shock response membrane anchor protein AmaP [Clostridia bacterium]